MLGVEPPQNRLLVEFADGERGELRYDQLVVALGSVSRMPEVPGLSEHALGFKSLADAIVLRNMVIAMLETAEASEDPQERSECLTFVFVGAGYAGVEGLAELQDFMKDVAEIDERSLRLSEGELIGTRTVVWTAGVRPPRGRLEPGAGAVGRRTRRRRRHDAGARAGERVGDRRRRRGPGSSAPGTALPADCPARHLSGRRVARNVAAELGAGGRVRPFGYRTPSWASSEADAERSAARPRVLAFRRGEV